MAGVGNDEADIMIVGASPGHSEDESGEPFSGDVGKKLSYLLKRAGLKRRNVFLSHALKCAPKYKKPKAIHVKACQKHIMKEVLRVKPKIIVAMGDNALETFIGEKNIGDNRGFFEDFEIADRNFKTKIIATYSPSGCLHKWEFDDLVIHDLKRARDYVKKGIIPKRKKLKYEFVTTLDHLKKVTKKLMNVKSFTFDFETTGLKFFQHSIIMSVFCEKPGLVYVIPHHLYAKEHIDKIKKVMEKQGRSRKDINKNLDQIKKINTFISKYEKELKAHMKLIFKSKAKKSAHNGKFDVNFARAAGFPVSNFTFDTCIAHSLIDENKPHNLTFCLEWYDIEDSNYEKGNWIYVNKSKARKKSYLFIPPLDLALYASKDADGTRRLKPILKKLLEKEGMVDLFYKQQMKLVNVMADIEYHGMKLDVQMLLKMSKKFQFEIADIVKETKKIAKNKDFNPASPTQLADYLEGQGAFGNRRGKQTPTGLWSTDEDSLKKLLQFKKYQKMPLLILEMRTLSKMKSTYMDGNDGKGGMLSWTDSNNFVHCSSNIHTPRTGRLSISDPALHQIPRPNPKYDINLRQIFIPSSKKNVIGIIDFKQLEMRVVAFLSKDLVMIKEIRNDVDIHSRNIVMFGTRLGILPENMTEKKFISIRNYEPPDDWKISGNRKQIKKKIHLTAEYEELRVMAKTIGFGLNYGKTAYSIAEEFNRETEEVEDMIQIYFDKYKRLNLWREDQKLIARTDGLLVLPETGRKRRFTCADWFQSVYSQECRMREMDLEAVYRQAMNFPIQGYANELFVSGGNYLGGKIKFHEMLRRKKMKSKIILSLHDGLYVDGPLSEMRTVEKYANACLPRILGEGTKYEVKLDIDFGVKDRWEGKKIKF